MAGSKEVVSIEELHERRKIVRQEVSASGEPENRCIVVQVEEISSFSRSMEERFKSIMDADNQPQYPNPGIRKVPIMLRDMKEFEKYFVPRVVSIGPYHHGNLKYQQAETIKLKFTKEFNNGNRQQMEGMYDAILKEIKKLRDFYDDEPTKNFDDEALAWMLFVDGCSLLHYIYCHQNKTLNKWKLKDHHVAFVHQDLFLLENQLPFCVLDLLMSTAAASERFQSKKGISMGIIDDFIKSNIETPGRKLPDLDPKDQKQKPSHLLDLLRTRLIGNKYDKRDQLAAEDQKDHSLHSFRNVMELRATGIHLKPSKTNGLGDVSFRPHHIFGRLTLPPIIIDDSTKPKFLNLIAYEMSPGTVSNLEVTSYICFLDSLIDGADDAKQLRSAGIVHNILGSDEQVAQLFNEIGTDLVPNCDIYNRVRLQIQKHYEDKGKSWMAQVIHDHFSTPWTIIAFIFIVFAILLSVLQTVFTIIGPLPDSCDHLCKNITKGLIKIKYQATEN